MIISRLKKGKVLSRLTQVCERFPPSLCIIGGRNLPQCEKGLRNFPSLSVKKTKNFFKKMVGGGCYLIAHLLLVISQMIQDNTPGHPYPESELFTYTQLGNSQLISRSILGHWSLPTLVPVSAPQLAYRSNPSYCLLIQLKRKERQN